MTKRGPKIGYKETEEHKRHKSEALRGRVLKVEVTYWGAHVRARKFFRGSPCEHCGKEGKVDAALRIDAPTESLRYSVDDHGWHHRWSVAVPPNVGYMPLCEACHVKYDTANGSWRKA